MVSDLQIRFQWVINDMYGDGDLCFFWQCWQLPAAGVWTVAPGTLCLSSLLMSGVWWPHQFPPAPSLPVRNNSIFEERFQWRKRYFREKDYSFYFWDVMKDECCVISYVGYSTHYEVPKYVFSATQAYLTNVWNANLPRCAWTIWRNLWKHEANRVKKSKGAWFKYLLHCWIVVESLLNWTWLR